MYKVWNAIPTICRKALEGVGRYRTTSRRTGLKRFRAQVVLSMRLEGNTSGDEDNAAVFEQDVRLGCLELVAIASVG